MARDWPVSLVTHVSSDHGRWYFHQPRPLSLGTQLTHGVQHSPGAKEQRTFLLAHFHVLRKFRQRWEKIKQLNFPTFPWSPDPCLVSHWHHSQGQGQLSGPAPLGKTDPRLGSCPNLFLGEVFARLESSSTPLTSFWHGPRPPHQWGFLVTIFSVLLAPGMLVMPRDEWIIPYIERWWELQRSIMPMHCLAGSATRRVEHGPAWADMCYLALINGSIIIGSPDF